MDCKFITVEPKPGEDIFQAITRAIRESEADQVNCNASVASKEAEQPMLSTDVLSQPQTSPVENDEGARLAAEPQNAEAEKEKTKRRQELREDILDELLHLARDSQQQIVQSFLRQHGACYPHQRWHQRRRERAQNDRRAKLRAELANVLRHATTHAQTIDALVEHLMVR